ncbi:tetratricopeptide repeat protein [Vibrio superstes]|uniref:tetratricopeptide repeat protein n=1 Tax=Vibrio superstes TaxID=198815 RepID=UPI0013C2EFC5|nr:tetratricopeptide repeat protein [Vibrio superstes]
MPIRDAIASSFDEQEMHLAQLSQDESLDLVTRAEATRILGQFSGPNALIAIGRASRSLKPQMRIAAIQAAAQWNGPARWDLVSPLLDDANRQVSTAAVMTLLPHWSQMTKVYRDKLSPYAKSYLSNLPNDLEGQLIAAWGDQAMGNLDGAEQRLQATYQHNPDARVALGYSKVLVANNKPQQAQDLLEESLTHFPKSAALYHELGRVLLAKGESAASRNAYQKAYQIDTTLEQYAFDYALALQDDDPQASLHIIESLYAQSLSPQYLYAKCEVMLVQGIFAEDCLADLTQATSQEVALLLREKNQQQLPKD